MINTILGRVPDCADEVLSEENEYLVTYINPYNYLKVHKEKSLLKAFDYITLDGILLVVLFRLFGLKRTSRMSPDFSSYFLRVFENASQNQNKFFFVGASPDKIVTAIENFKVKFPELLIAGYHSGFFNEGEKQILIREILDKRPEIVIVGMGVIRQENFLIDLKKQGWKGRGYACGGFLHQTAIKPVYYPEWISRIHLRWVYRIFSEPKLVKRYFIEYPIALIFIVKDVVLYKLNR